MNPDQASQIRQNETQREVRDLKSMKPPIEERVEALELWIGVLSAKTLLPKPLINPSETDGKLIDRIADLEKTNAALESENLRWNERNKRWQERVEGLERQLAEQKSSSEFWAKAYWSVGIALGISEPECSGPEFFASEVLELKRKFSEARSVSESRRKMLEKFSFSSSGFCFDCGGSKAHSNDCELAALIK